MYSDISKPFEKKPPFVYSVCWDAVSMGFYVNPGNENFRRSLANDIFVDKSMLLAELNKRIGTAECFFCVSRPRRFGKTMAEAMMAAYYSIGCDSAGLFSNTKIASDPSFAKRLNKYNVLHVDVNRFWSQYGGDAISRMHEMVRDDFAEAFPEMSFKDDWEIPNCVMEVFKRTKTPFVVIFDEYDVLFRDERVPSGLLDSYLMFLNVLFKSSDVSTCIALAYITGILPIIREKAQSKLNNFKEITFLNPGRFVQFTGFTEEEVRSLCDRYSMDFNECRSWYDGYRLRGLDIYAPRSVVCAMEEESFKPYWNQTSSFRAVRDVIALDFDGMRLDVERMISGESVPLNATRFENDPSRISSRDDVFTYLCHLGYLAYSAEEETCRIPNREVRGEWVNAIEDLPDYSNMLSMIRVSKSLLESVWSGDASAVAAALEKTHEKLTSPLSYNNEKSFQSAIRLAFLYADSYYTLVLEYPSGKGYADIAFIPYKPNIPAMVVELKAKGTAGTALDQIREKRYFAGLDKYEGNMLLVGVSYDKDTKAHECRIDKA